MDFFKVEYIFGIFKKFLANKFFFNIYFVLHCLISYHNYIWLLNYGILSFAYLLMSIDARVFDIVTFCLILFNILVLLCIFIITVSVFAVYKLRKSKQINNLEKISIILFIIISLILVYLTISMNEFFVILKLPFETKIF